MADFVAEFTTNHMGNLNVLLRMVERAVWAGCSYIKMQKKDVESFYSKEKLDSLFESPYGKRLHCTGYHARYLLRNRAAIRDGSGNSGYRGTVDEMKITTETRRHREERA